ncbi:hypothetical protein BDR06DRAFT_994494 [Suillus hirtellus]|nr:hypothetical protein BDR06DRAFT_994494 [Suillus hirtellus]
MNRLRASALAMASCSRMVGTYGDAKERRHRSANAAPADWRPRHIRAIMHILDENKDGEKDSETTSKRFPIPRVWPSALARHMRIGHLDKTTSNWKDENWLSAILQLFSQVWPMMEVQVKVHWCPEYQLDVRFTGGDLTRYRSCSLTVFGGGVYSRPYVYGETLDSAIQSFEWDLQSGIYSRKKIVRKSKRNYKTMYEKPW